MKITVLLENTTLDAALGCAHGLALLVERDEGDILIDTGPGRQFLDNAEILGKDMNRVSAAVISHGHRDHGGGLEYFLKTNEKAKVYLHGRSFESHWALRPDGSLKDVSLDASLPAKYPGRMHFVGDHFQLDENISLFTCHRLPGRRPQMNENLFSGPAGAAERDDFEHEINVLIKEGERSVLFVGCAHVGISNIIRGCRELCGTLPDVVLGGFHLMSKGLGRCESPETVAALGEELAHFGCNYITGHCTGEPAMGQLRVILGESLLEMSSGATFFTDSGAEMTHHEQGKTL